MIEPSIPPLLQETIARELQQDETVVWSGMPKPTYFSQPAARLFWSGIGLTTVTFLFLASSVGFMQEFSFLDPGDLIFPLCSFVFFAWGITMISAPLRAYRRSLKTVYVITDRRAISMEVGRTTIIRSYPPEKLIGIRRRDYKDGTGDVLISRPAWRSPEDDWRKDELGFLRVLDASSVEAKLRQLAERHAGRSSEVEA